MTSPTVILQVSINPRCPLCLGDRGVTHYDIQVRIIRVGDTAQAGVLSCSARVSGKEFFTQMAHLKHVAYIYVFLLLVGFNIHCRHLLHRFKPLASQSKIHMQRLDPEGDKTLVQFTASQIIWSWDRQRSVVFRLLGKKQKHL